MESAPPRREYLLTVGNIEKSIATLVDLDYNVLELPRYMLPEGAGPGSCLRMNLVLEEGEQERRAKEVG